MNKKDFELIAKIVRGMYKLNDDQKAYVARKFSVHLMHSNPNFDVDQFLEACR